jgi:hypothetical protein
MAASYAAVHTKPEWLCQGYNRLLFVRIGTYQWVTTNPSKKIFSPVTLCLKSHNLLCLVAAGSAGAARVDPANEEL